MRYAVAGTVLAACLAGPAIAEDLAGIVSAELPGLIDTYKGLHSRPELSRHEAETSAALAEELRKAGYRVTEHVGVYADGSKAYGVVAVLENGPGPRLLIRADLDALPVVEETGVPYASHVRTQNAAGEEVGVMHACGHDVHVTTLIGTARALAKLKSQWRGTLLLIGQPSEETGDGAKALLADHLYERFGTPDLAIALHDTALHPAGSASITSGPALASMTAIDVTLRGVGGHGARPQDGKDPIVMAGEFIVALQTIVSRSENPLDPTVVTIGSIHGGTKRNVIPNEVKLELTARAFTEPARQIILDGIRRTALGVALAAGVPEDRAPIIAVLAEVTPVTDNDPALAARVKAGLAAALGSGNVFDEPPLMVSEDFGMFGLESHRIPTAIFWLGAADPARFAQARATGQALPGLHTSRFQPDPEPTLRAGVTAMSTVAIRLLHR